MVDDLTSFLGRSGLLPHGYCIAWSPALLWSMVGADAVISLAYFSIPVAIVRFVRRRGDMPMRWVAWLFSAFIFACGVTHVLAIWTLWQPDYGLETIAKLATAAISALTAVALWPLMPKALKIPTVGQLQAAIASLEAEVRRRRTAEEHLADIEQSLAVTLASIEAGIIAADRQGRVTRMNAVAEQVKGWTQQEASGRGVFEVFEREGRPPDIAARNPIDVMIELGVTVGSSHHVVAIGRHGQRTALEVKAALTHGDNGVVRGLAMVFRDMTRLEQTEAERQRLADIVESSHDAIIGKTLGGRITSWNAAACALFGYPVDEAIGQPVQMLIPPDREAEEMQILADLSRGNSVPAFDTVRVTKDGTHIAVSLTISPIRDATGRIVGAAKIVRDVSHQRRAEVALRESDARLRFALEAAQIGDWDLDLTTGEARRSIRHDRCFGHETLQPTWRFETFLSRVHPDDRADVEQAFRAAEQAQSDWRVVCRVIWPDGSEHWISSVGRIHREDGASPHMLGIVTDITRQKQDEAARMRARSLEAENRQIQEASRLKSQFLANMSHELRTPLNAIIGFSELMQAGAVPATSPKHQEFLGHIASSGRHLLKLINDVLDLSKAESGKFDFFPETVDLPTLAGEVREMLLPTARRKHLSIELDIGPGLSPLVLDPARLRQVLYSYLSNAVKFTPDGGHITVRARVEGDAHFRIEVEDTGIGIAPADLARLFVEFQQLDAGFDRQHEGTGLGLALTRRLVQAQGGSVGVRSTPGVGSVFHLVLRRAALSEPRA